MSLVTGLISGFLAGSIMGVMSHTGYKAGIFKSSLFLIDGSFTLRRLGIRQDARYAVPVGVPVHLATSVSFGIAYAFLTQVMDFEPANAWTVGIYVFLLWLSMLFVALPVAGHGVFGKKLGSRTWLEQLLLHALFGAAFWKVLRIM